MFDMIIDVMYHSGDNVPQKVEVSVSLWTSKNRDPDKRNNWSWRRADADRFLESNDCAVLRVCTLLIIRQRAGF